jgi:hypothetical protein
MVSGKLNSPDTSCGRAGGREAGRKGRGIHTKPPHSLWRQQAPREAEQRGEQSGAEGDRRGKGGGTQALCGRGRKNDMGDMGGHGKTRESTVAGRRVSAKGGARGPGQGSVSGQGAQEESLGRFRHFVGQDREHPRGEGSVHLPTHSSSPATSPARTTPVCSTRCMHTSQQQFYTHPTAKVYTHPSRHPRLLTQTGRSAFPRWPCSPTQTARTSPPLPA